MSATATAEERVDTAQARIKGILTKVDTYNRAAPPQGRMMVPIQEMELTTAVDAILDLLFPDEEKRAEFAALRAEKLADVLEAAWADSAEQRRAASGLLVPRR